MAESKRSTAASKRLRAYRRLFSTEDGKLVLEDLMKSCFMGRTVVGRDANETYFNEGARSVVLRIIQTVAVTDEQIKALVTEMDRVDEEQQLFI